MIQFSSQISSLPTLLSPLVAGPLVTAPGAEGFAVTLADLIGSDDGPDDADPVAALAEDATDERQDGAADGNALPPFAWLALPVALSVQTSVSPAALTAGVTIPPTPESAALATPITTPATPNEIELAPIVNGQTPAAQAQTPPAIGDRPVVVGAAIGDQIVEPIVEPLAPPVTLVATRLPSAVLRPDRIRLPEESGARPVREERSASDPLAIVRQPPAPPPPVIGVTQPAAQAFAAAISTAAIDLVDPGRRTSTSAEAVEARVAPLVDIQRDAGTPAVAPARDALIDTRRQAWLDGMLDHIEALRDAADARDTRIRLIPDALGKLDIAIRKDGDTLHVQFTAETQAARQLLTDAQPRLADIAEQRGLRLGQSTVGLGAGGAGPERGFAEPQSQDRTQSQHQPLQVARTNSEPGASADPTDAADERRIA